MANIEKKKNDLGFLLIETRRTYAPLLLDCCILSKKCRKYYVDTPYGYSKLTPEEKGCVKLWVMCGEKRFEGRDFYCRTQDSPKLFKIQGNYRFLFDGRQFFETLIHASKRNFNLLCSQTVVADEEELNRFISLILHHWKDLTEKERNRGLSQARKLAKQF